MHILEQYLRTVLLQEDRITDYEREQYPYNIPALKNFHCMDLHPRVTFLMGENGSGKSTLVEAIAIAAGYNAEEGHVILTFIQMKVILHFIMQFD